MRLYKTDSNWSLRKDVRARGLRWTITDTCLSQDQKFLLYASISPIVHLVGPRGRPACVVFVQLMPLLACQLLQQLAAHVKHGHIVSSRELQTQASPPSRTWWAHPTVQAAGAGVHPAVHSRCEMHGALPIPQKL